MTPGRLRGRSSLFGLEVPRRGHAVDRPGRIVNRAVERAVPSGTDTDRQTDDDRVRADRVRRTATAAEGRDARQPLVEIDGIVLNRAARRSECPHPEVAVPDAERVPEIRRDDSSDVVDILPNQERGLVRVRVDDDQPQGRREVRHHRRAGIAIHIEPQVGQISQPAEAREVVDLEVSLVGRRLLSEVERAPSSSRVRRVDRDGARETDVLRPPTQQRAGSDRDRRGGRDEDDHQNQCQHRGAKTLHGETSDRMDCLAE